MDDPRKLASPGSDGASGSPLDAEFEALRQRLHGLTACVLDQTRTARRRHRILLGVGVLLLGTSAFSLLSLTSTAAALDAEALTQIARVQIEQQLPEGRESLRSYLTDTAPRLVKAVLRAVLDTIPRFRSLLLGQVESHIADINQEFERQLTDRIRFSLRRLREEIEVDYPRATEEEKREKLAAFAARDLQAALDECLNEIHPAYSAELNRIQSYLESLHRRDPSQLTEKERIHREIFETLLRLILHPRNVSTGDPAPR